MRHAIINKKGQVVNVVIWEGHEWLPPRDHWVVRADNCDIGDLYDFEKDQFFKADNTALTEERRKLLAERNQ